jgi:spore germination protein KA
LSTNDNEKNQSSNKAEYSKKLSTSLDSNIALFKEIFSKDDTLRIRNIQNQYQNSIRCSTIFIDGMVNNDYISENIIRPILNADLSKDNPDNIFYKLLNQILPSSDVKESTDIYEIVNCIIGGDTVLLVDHSSSALIIDSKDFKVRAIGEPTSEKALRGSKEGFTESLITNLSLIRRRAKNTNLKFQFKRIGKETNTNICLCYIEGTVQDKILNELITRLDQINIDSVLDSQYIQEMIQDTPLSPFETVGSTERPDVVVGKLLEGRIAILVDGTPFALTVPFLFIEYFQTGEDYYNNYFFMSFNRIIRIIGFIFTVSVPALYISIVTYNQEMIPTNLLLSIYAARENVPLPTIVEAILMIFSFEVLREAGTRLPSDLGEAISIVGALVLGQAAVDARLVSAPMVIIVAITGIVGLLNIKIVGATIFLRFIFLVLSAFLGIYGYLFGIIGFIVYLMSLRSFGVNYMNTVGSFNSESISDSPIRAPWWYLSLHDYKISVKGRIKRKNR